MDSKSIVDSWIAKNKDGSVSSISEDDVTKIIQVAKTHQGPEYVHFSDFDDRIVFFDEPWEELNARSLGPARRAYADLNIKNWTVTFDIKKHLRNLTNGHTIRIGLPIGMDHLAESPNNFYTMPGIWPIIFGGRISTLRGKISNIEMVPIEGYTKYRVGDVNIVKKEQPLTSINLKTPSQGQTLSSD